MNSNKRRKERKKESRKTREYLAEMKRLNGEEFGYTLIEIMKSRLKKLPSLEGIDKMNAMQKDIEKQTFDFIEKNKLKNAENYQKKLGVCKVLDKTIDELERLIKTVILR